MQPDILRSLTDQGGAENWGQMVVPVDSKFSRLTQPVEHVWDLTLPGDGPSTKRRRVVDELPESKLVRCLVDMVGRGGAHVVGAAEIARAALEDCGHGAKAAQALEALGSCGTGGKHDGNAARDFHRWTKGMGGVFLEPYPIKLTLQAARLKRLANQWRSG